MKFGICYSHGGQLYRRRRDSFTLVELLTVILIIVILASLTLAAANAVMARAARSRASSEIQALSTALESYKTDNGIYPLATNFADTNAYAQSDPSVIREAISLHPKSYSWPFPDAPTTVIHPQQTKKLI